MAKRTPEEQAQIEREQLFNLKIVVIILVFVVMALSWTAAREIRQANARIDALVATVEALQMEGKP